ncbi:PD-(D/E)XK nuclease family transposase [Desulfoscipio gibsoniae]|uniref:PD-(D/E)XK nuclease family transposase n=1 Tax=Desulfoscipio gibsoniae TaxID=102134 RepID=UPI000232AFF0|nr:PD-(D/E)XK nuclease family transposase [Desulfoscipio gibsoniae]
MTIVPLYNNALLGIKDKVFENSLQPFKTITINILGFDWFQDRGRYHHVFHVREDETGRLLSDDLEIHFLELEKIKSIKRRPKDRLDAG